MYLTDAYLVFLKKRLEWKKLSNIRKIPENKKRGFHLHIKKVFWVFGKDDTGWLEPNLMILLNFNIKEIIYKQPSRKQVKNQTVLNLFKENPRAKDNIYALKILRKRCCGPRSYTQSSCPLSTKAVWQTTLCMEELRECNSEKNLFFLKNYWLDLAGQKVNQDKPEE